MFQSLPKLSYLPKEEERILSFWKKQQIFQKSLRLREGCPRFTFYEGPPTANGYPHAGHVIGRSIKDLIPRYKTMCGFFVPRKAGWDTHGLPVELEVEKELGIRGKQDIERFGVEAFNARCKESVFRYIREWEKLTERLGIWMDLEHPYITCTNEYIESLWWILKELWKQGLLYQGHKVLPYCPRCGTSLSSHEVALGYRETDDPSVYVKFAVKGKAGTFFLVWTTTPWTLVANVALAVGKDLPYVEIESKDGTRFILGKESLEKLFQEGTFRVLREMKGEDLVGLEYEPLLPFVRAEKGYRVFAGDFVSMAEGTGIVHIAPAFGEDDMRLAQKEGLPVLQPVLPDGTYDSSVEPWKGLWVKDADPLIIDYLRKEGKLFRKETYRHSYPFCWRCDTPLLYYAKESWFIKTTAFRELLLENNRKIHWVPEHIRDGRFGDFLENVVDWALSRERYWGTPLNIWKCDTCGFADAVGSLEELRSRSLSPIGDIELHRPYVDRVLLSCPQCGGVMRRVPEVIDCWFDSGAMFVAQHHYPFENQEEFARSFPADFICEAIDQTRGWFYSLHVLASMLFRSPAFLHCLVTELGLDEKGQKMSKHIGNVVNPWNLVEAYGADVLRWYIFSVSPPWVPKRFGKSGLREVLSKFFDTLWNVVNFFILYANIDRYVPPDSSFEEPEHLLDRWLVNAFRKLVKEVREALDRFEISKAAKSLEEFVIEDLSNWYIRRSRRRFWKSQWDGEKAGAYRTLYAVLIGLTKLLAPFVPFTAELLYQTLAAPLPSRKESVHLEDYPEVQEELVDRELLQSMDVARKLVNLGRAVRNKVGVKLRQPLRKATLVLPRTDESRVRPFAGLVQDELNVKDIEWAEELPDTVAVRLKPRFALLGPRYGEKVKEIAKALASCPQDVARRFLQEGQLLLSLAGTEVALSLDEVEVVLETGGHFSVESEGQYAVILDTTLDEALKEEGLVRDFVHSIQMWRKELGLDVEERIVLLLSKDSDPYLLGVVERYRELIEEEVLAQEVSVGSVLCGESTVREFHLDGRKILLSLRRLV
ncbi:isoleucine--tRNA ligase [Candidatus Caldatribacterium sp. SIUC1]|uniref:isoleucine--tRNA ligase n=1 Tax=Candidatus Caldatribacterium sp. SIUC1 TaxID=3418365 RepID=UPI003F68C6E2